MSIQVSNLLKLYGTQKAVNQISFQAQKGEILGFLGPNGAGKSTTMKMITGYLSPDAGTIEVCGINVVTNPIEAKKKIGYLSEANPLYFDMYVREYLAFIAGMQGVNVRRQTSDVKRSDAPTFRRKVVDEVISKVGLEVEAHKKIGQLSKGYKQRVGLAAALIHDPEVLILDEPTSGLDPNQIIEIRELIKSLGKEKTILFSSHILPEVEALCDRIVIIHRGAIVSNNTLTEMKQQGSLEQVFHSLTTAVAG